MKFICNIGRNMQGNVISLSNADCPTRFQLSLPYNNVKDVRPGVLHGYFESLIGWNHHLRSQPSRLLVFGCLARSHRLHLKGDKPRRDYRKERTQQQEHNDHGG
jgi:hypothetical protein